MSLCLNIVISHDAPKLCGLGVIHQRFDREDAGNPWLADEMLRKHPRYTFCGHIHSGEHELQTLDDMKMANVSLVMLSHLRRLLKSENIVEGVSVVHLVLEPTSLMILDINPPILL